MSAVTAWPRSPRPQRRWPPGTARSSSPAAPNDRVNVNGGAIALGHPIGMSSARLALTLALELGRRGDGTGAATLCGGGGQGDALIRRVLQARPPRPAGDRMTHV
jgi:acetyl-CoA acetyltransferase